MKEENHKNKINWRYSIIETVCCILILMLGMSLGELKSMVPVHHQCNDFIVENFYNDTLYIGEDGKYYAKDNGAFIDPNNINIPFSNDINFTGNYTISINER